MSQSAIPFVYLFIFLFAVHYLCTALKKIKHTCSIGMQSLITMESKEWHSGESAGLPSMWPRVQIPASDAMCGLILLLALSLPLRGFSRGIPDFPSSKKPTFPNSNSPDQERGTCR